MRESFNLQNVPNYIGGPDITIVGLKTLSILFGKNGSGKSLLLRKIASTDPDNTHYCNPEKGGTFSYHAQSYETESDGKGRNNNRLQNINQTYYQQIITRIHSFFAKRGTWTDGIPPVSHSDIENLIQLLLPDYNIKIKTEKPYLEVKNTSENAINLDELSSGERHILGLGIDTTTICAIWHLENRRESILLIDEPDAHLHHDLHQNFALFIKTLIEKFSIQIIISTHSTTLLAALRYYMGNKASVAYLKKGENVHRAFLLSKIQNDLASILGGHALMGPLFNVPLLLVEGDDDYRIWSQVPRHHKFNFSVIPCNGEEIFNSQKTLENLFSSMLSSNSSPSGFALLDGDKSLPDHRTVPQNHIKFIKLNCHESENMYITDTVLNKMDIADWEKAKSTIVSRADSYGSKANELKNADQWDKQNHDLKELIAEISAILDPKQLHWTTRIGKIIGSGEISGELKKFLGESVIEALLKQ